MNKREQAAEITLNPIKGGENHSEVGKYSPNSSRCLQASPECIFQQWFTEGLRNGCWL